MYCYCSVVLSIQYSCIVTKVVMYCIVLQSNHVNSLQVSVVIQSAKKKAKTNSQSSSSHLITI